MTVSCSLIVVVVVLVASGCSEPSHEEDAAAPGDDRIFQTDQPRTSSESVGLNEQDQSTPLAIVPALEVDIDEGEGGDEYFTSPDIGLKDGWVSITPTCVTWTFDSTKQSVTLTWHEGTADYDSSSNTVSFTPVFDGQTVAVRDGDRIDVGGTPATGTRNFVIAPDTECPVDVFIVNDITVSSN